MRRRRPPATVLAGLIGWGIFTALAWHHPRTPFGVVSALLAATCFVRVVDWMSRAAAALPR